MTHGSDPSITYRGPILLSVSLTYLLVPITRSLQTILTSEILIWLILWTFGIYYTISDHAFVIQDRLKSVQEKIQGIASKIILDSVLRDAISSVSCLGCGWIGLVGAYTVPLSCEDRARLLQSILPGHVDAKRVLFIPGGFWEYLPLPEGWRKKIAAGNKSNDFGGGNSEEIDSNNVQSERNLDDLLWEDIDGLEAETDSWTDEGQIMSSPSSITAERISSEYKEDSVFTATGRDQDEKYRTTKNGRITSPTQAGFTLAPNLEETMNMILNRFLKQSSHAMCKKVNHKQLRSIGIIATICLCVQLKTSAAARKVVQTTFSASMTFGLINAIVGSFATLKVKSRIMQLFPEETDNSCEGSNSDSQIFERLHWYLSQQWQNTFTAKFEHLVGVRRNASIFVDSIRNDPKIKRKLQGVLAVLLLHYFRKRKRVKI